MRPTDVARVLAKAAAFDQRTVGDADVLAWTEAIGDLDAADALAAVTRHYRESTTRIWPADVRRLAADVDRDRRRAAREADELEAEARAIEAAPVRDRSADVNALLAQLRDALPPLDADALKPRSAYWRREYRVYTRQRQAQPNPHYRPAQPPTTEPETPDA